MSVFLKEVFDPTKFLDYAKRKLAGYSYNQINKLVTSSQNINSLEKKQKTLEEIKDALIDIEKEINSEVNKERKAKLLEVKEVLTKLKTQVGSVDVTEKDPTKDETKKEEPKEEPKEELPHRRKIELE